MMETKTTDIEELFYKIRDYGETRFTLLKLKAINKVSGIASSAITLVFLLFLLFMILLCVTIGLSLLIGVWVGHAYLGFFIVGGIYVIIGLVLFLAKTKLIKTPISNSLIRKLVD